MKHRSVSKVRSNKLAKKTRFLNKQLSNIKHTSIHPFKQLWVSNMFIASSTDPITKIEVPARIMTVHGTYCKAKHDIPIVGKDGVTTYRRYVAS